MCSAALEFLHENEKLQEEIRHFKWFISRIGINPILLLKDLMDDVDRTKKAHAYRSLFLDHDFTETNFSETGKQRVREYINSLRTVE